MSGAALSHLATPTEHLAWLGDLCALIREARPILATLSQELRSGFSYPVSTGCSGVQCRHSTIVASLMQQLAWSRVDVPLRRALMAAREHAVLPPATEADA